MTKSKTKMKLMDAGKKLLHLPSSNADLLQALSQMEQFLSGVQRSSSESTMNALHPIIDALIDKKLVKNPDMDVNISVCCCLCEIMRIMAPELPYTGKETKEFLKLVVTTFEKLSITSGGCYTRMTKFFDIFSNFSLPALMSSLQLDRLIVRLFKQFLNAADSNSPAVVCKMEEFMTMIIEESEPLNLELVDLLVTAVRMDNKIRSPFCWQLAENIIDSCADQLRPHLPHMESKECYPHTTEKSMLLKETTHKIKLECLEDTDNLVNVHLEVKMDHVEVKKETLSFEKSPVSAISVTDVNGKRKRDDTPQKKQVQYVEYGENLVGSRIKVWWPDDKLYYPGVVKSFDCIRKRHKLLYDDGEEEVLDLKEEQWEFAENVSAMSDSLEREMDSSTESSITCVNGYKVNHNVAPILKAIIMKYGDIAAKCVFKGASVRALILESVCEIVRRIKTNDAIRMKEIETDLIDAEAANINVSWLRAHVEAIERKEDMKRCSLLMEMKVNSGLARKAAKMDLKERQIELMAAQQRFDEAERCVKVLDLVQQKLSNNIFEIEAKKKPSPIL
uniref:sister chromatid cohesion protein PDS5-like n=1 Tax=Erigeron canadensis TaxID=72917 RepID=UPI001CB8ADD8|nr:sister chromatid cohesion protein PDS5-like [Erigeron canadensis]